MTSPIDPDGSVFQDVSVAIWGSTTPGAHVPVKNMVADGRLDDVDAAVVDGVHLWLEDAPTIP
jgi:hypothetical protein